MKMIKSGYNKSCSQFKMRQLFYISTLLISLSFAFINDDPFVGVVSFKLIYTDLDVRLPEDYVCSSSGDSMIYYYSPRGFFKKYYCNDHLIQRRWFNSHDNSLNMLTESDDTLNFYFANETDFSSKIQKTDITERILGHTCQKFIVTLEPKENKNLPIVISDYYITTDLEIDTKPFENYLDGGYSELLSEMPGLILKQTDYGPYYTMTRIAVDLRQEKVNIRRYMPTRKLIKKKL